jgi:hypothetical protein
MTGVPGQGMFVANGVIREIDLSAFLNTAKNPKARKYLGKRLFRNFKLEYGDIVWNDYEMCFPIWDLYEGKV